MSTPQQSERLPELMDALRQARDTQLDILRMRVHYDMLLALQDHHQRASFEHQQVRDF